MIEIKNESEQNKTIYDYLRMIDDVDTDISDDYMDFYMYVTYTPDDEVKDPYEEFSNYVVKNTPFIRKIDEYSILVSLSTFVKNNWEAFVEFTENNNDDNYKMSAYDDEDDQLEVAMYTLESMLEGNYAQEDYEDFMRNVKGN